MTNELSHSDFRIAPMNPDDATEIATLSKQLSYPTLAEEIAVHLIEIRASPQNEVFIARLESDTRVVGWIHAYEHLSVTAGSRCEIGGLVVDEKLRGQGIGRKLMHAVEQWAQTKNLRSIQFSSRITRSEAHQFYHKLGYRVLKTSHIFSKELV